MRRHPLPFLIILLFMLGLQTAQAQSFRLLSSEANTRGIDFSYAQASYNEERAGFEIRRIIPLVQNPNSINKIKFFIGASREGKEAESWTYTRDKYPVEWHVLVDVSKSMSSNLRTDPAAVTKGARAAKALEIVKDMLNSCPAQDRIIISFFSTDFVQVADVLSGASRNAAANVLNMQKVREVGNANYNGDNTTLYPLLARYVGTKLAGKQQETHRVVVLITDGEDESANQHKHWENVRRAFTEKGIRLNIFLIAPPANGTRGDSEASTLTGNLAPETGGTYKIIRAKDLTLKESTAPMVATEHAGYGAFFLPIKRANLDALTIQFLSGDQQQAAVAWEKEAVLATAGPAPRSAEDIAAEEARNKAAEKYKELPPLVAATEKALQTLGEQEAADTPKETLQQTVENAQKAVEELIKGLEAVKAFALPDYAVLKDCIKDEATNTKLQELLLLHPLSENTVLAALGRTTPLNQQQIPTEIVVEKEKLNPLYFWVGGAGLTLVILLVALYIARIRRMKREQREWQAKMDSLKAKVPTPHKPVYGVVVCLQTGEEWPVYKEAMTIGRTEDNDIILSDAGVSGHHCVLKKNRNGAWVLNDLNSNNGIYCQGKVFTTLNMLPEVSFILGRTELLFRPKE